MAASPGHQMLANSFNVIRSPISVLSVAPFSPARDMTRLNYSARHRPGNTQGSSIFPRKAPGFDSLEPASPEVGCMGQIKLNQKWTKASEHRAKKKPRSKKLSKIWKFIFGSQGGNRGRDCGVGRGDFSIDEDCTAPYPNLGQIKRFTSGSYDAKFGDICGRPQPFVASSGWLSD